MSRGATQVVTLPTLAVTQAVTHPTLAQATRAMATTEAPQLRMPRATFQAQRLTGNHAMSRDVTLAVTHPILAQAIRAVTRPMAATVATLVVAL